jgi:hypothetical protein
VSPRSARFFAVALASFGASFALLLAAPAGDAPPPLLEHRAPAAPAPPVAVESDFAAPGSGIDFRGRLLWLRGVSLKRVHGDGTVLEAGFRDVVREAGRPRARDVWCRFLERDEEGAARIVATLESPRLDGDPAQLFAPEEGAPRSGTLSGGVVARDGKGRTLLRVPDRLDVDFTTRTVATAERVELAYPDERLQVRGTGLVAEGALRRATLVREVEAEVEIDGAVAALWCDGPLEATLRGETLRVVAQGAVHLAAKDLALRCDRLEILLPDAKRARHAAARAIVDAAGSVRAESPRGWTLEAPRVVLEGDRAAIEGPLRLEGSGRLRLFGEGERRVRLDAGSASLLLARAGLEEPAWLECELLGGVAAAADDGGALAAARVVLEPDRVLAEGEVRAHTPHGEIRADRILAEGRRGEALVVVVSGEKLVRAPVKAELGEGGGDRERDLALACEGDLVFSEEGDVRSVRAERGVAALLVGEGSPALTLECDALQASFAGDRVTRLDARGGVALCQGASEASADRLVHDAASQSTTLFGAPARVAGGRDGGSGEIQAHEIEWSDAARRFRAVGCARFHGPARSGDWRVACDRLEGELDERGRPLRLEASGALEALGPAGERAWGDGFRLEGRRAALSGAPARVAFGETFELRARSILFELDERDELRAAETVGAGEFDFAPAREAGAAGPARWRGKLLGPARFEGLVVSIPRGVEVVGLGAEGETLYEGEAGSAAIDVVREGRTLRARALRGEEGVEIRVHRGEGGPLEVRARRLVTEPDRGRIVLDGDARVAGGGFAPGARFGRVELILDEHGLSEVRAYGLEVGER